MRLVRRFLTELAAALAGFGAARAVTTSPDSREPRAESVDSVRDVWATEEESSVVRAAWHPELHSRYTGPVVGLADQISLMSGRRLRNSCLGGATEEFEQFIQERTRD